MNYTIIRSKTNSCMEIKTHILLQKINQNLPLFAAIVIRENHKSLVKYCPQSIILFTVNF